jgi:flagellar hook protein FlgE
MIDSIYTGITGVRSHQERLNVIGNNVANINTTAFKSGRVAFSDVMSQTLSEGSGARDQISATNPQQTGLGVRVSSIDTVQTQGSLQLTGIDMVCLSSRTEPETSTPVMVRFPSM